MQAIVPAAGKGTRLGSLTADRPKGLVEIADRPLLGYVFDQLVGLGVDEIIVILGYEGEQIRETFGDSFKSIPIRYVWQPEQRGLAHAISQASERISGDFIVLNGDNVFCDPIPAIDLRDADGTLLVERVSREAASKTGVVEVVDGLVDRIVEKPELPPSTLATTGFYQLPAAFMDASKEIDPAPTGEYELADALSILIEDGYRFRAVPYSGTRFNVNTPQDIGRVEAHLALCGS